MRNSTRLLVSTGINFLIHFVFLAAGGLALHYGFSSQKILDPALLSSLNSSSAESIPYYVGDAIGQSERWLAFMTSESLVVSTLWLALTNAVSPAGPTQARSRLGAWFAALMILLTAAGSLAWWIFVHKHIATNLSERFLTPLLIVSGIGVLIAFYLGCAIGVKAAMRPSVPFADAWLR